MTGVTSYLDVNAALAGMEHAAIAVAHPTALLRQIGIALRQSTQDRFNAGTDPQGNPWAPLLPAYAAVKRGPSILVGSGMSGGLQGSISFDTGATTVEVGSNRIYAAVHQFGAVIKPVRAKHLVVRLAGGLRFANSVTIPERPYLGISAGRRNRAGRTVRPVHQQAAARRLTQSGPRAILSSP